MMVGTDSHTPECRWIGYDCHWRGRCRRSGRNDRYGMGIEDAELIGVKLTGALNGWASPKM